MKLRAAPVSDRAVVIENDNLSLGLQPRCLLTADYRLTVYPGCDDGELYDLRSDPHECRNLWYDETHRSVRDHLQHRLLAEYSVATPFYPVPVWNA